MSLDWDTLSWFQAKPNISDIEHLINQNNILFIFSDAILLSIYVDVMVLTVTKLFVQIVT